MAKKAFDASVSEFCRAIGLLIRRVRAAAGSSKLSISESMVLGRLEREGSMTTAELARTEGVRPQSMGTTVAALEEMGLIARSPHPTDGRQMILSLTAKGTAMRKNVRSAKELWIAQGIAQLNKQEQETLFAAGEIIRRMVETKLIENTPVEK